MEVVVVYGPPLSGKTTYVKENITDDDIVFDYDAMAQAITFGDYQDNRPNTQDILLILRNTMIDCTQIKKVGKLYIITTFLSKKITNRIEDNGMSYKAIKMDVDIDVCIDRLNKSDRPNKEGLKKAIREWYSRGINKPASDRKVDKETKRFYKSKEWRRLRELVLIRDNYECQHCKEKGIVKTINPDKHKSLDVDHIKELDSHPELALDMDNLVTLCISCHNKKHNRYQNGFPTKKNKWSSDEWW
ncbi:hypothetical protein SCA05_24830 [Staphylococcus carnosus]|nr:hypothetical protein SCA05_24830 [Staphylococcus carnosus]SUM06989.1 phage-associated homing endonuclease [Staphylococcus carnosus]